MQENVKTPLILFWQNGQIIIMNHATDATLSSRAEIFKALGHPSRLFIATHLRRGPQSVGELTELVGVDTSTVSKHLLVLRQAGIVRGDRKGTTIRYRLACNCLGQMLDATESILRIRAAEAQAAVEGGDLLIP